MFQASEWAEDLVTVAAICGHAPTVTPSHLSGWNRSLLLAFLARGFDGMLETLAPLDRSKLSLMLADYRPTSKQLARALRVVHTMDERRQKAADLIIHLEEAARLMAELQ